MGLRRAALDNLDKAMLNWRRPRLWRSPEESEMIRRLVFWWFTGRGDKPSARAWARGLRISHTWMLKLIRQFKANPAKAWELQAGLSDPTSRELEYARERTEELRMRGEIRPFLRCARR